jgi:hypothetical protein
MAKHFYSLITILMILIFANSLKAEDTLTVQTFTFDDITKRRGVWQFPDGSDTYRKILAYYTLKCDRQTAQDIFDCGEWDYGANIFIYQHTGVMDSNLVTHPKYNFGGGNPETIELNVNGPQPKEYYQEKREFTVIDNVISETEHIVGTGDQELILDGVTRFQVLYTKDFLKESGLAGKEFQRLRLKTKTPGVKLVNLKIKQLNSSDSELNELFDIGSAPLYHGDYTFGDDEWSYIDLNMPLKTNPFQGFILEFSFDRIMYGSELSLYADEYSEGVISNGYNGAPNSYLEFDGQYDRVDCGVVQALKSSEKFTVEMNIRLHAWRNNGNFFRIGNGLEFKTVEEYNQPRRYYIRMQDGDDFGIMVGGSVAPSDRWSHFAIVFDGSKDQYDGRIKMYIDGVEIPGHIRGKFPDKFPDADNILRLNWTDGNMNCDIGDFRIWTDALPQETIKGWVNKIIDETHPSFDDLQVYYNYFYYTLSDGFVINQAQNKNAGFLIGSPQVKTITLEERPINLKDLGFRPVIGFVEGEYESHKTEEIVTTEDPADLKTVIEYRIIDNQAVPYFHDMQDVVYGFLPGTYYTYDPDGNKIDSTVILPDTIIEQEQLEYYSAPYEKIVRKEIGRSITPYGKGLDLGENGFTWVYDMTDYTPWLQGEIDMSAHSQLELLDLKFLFIKGTPPRDVLDIQSLWVNDANNVSYKALSYDDNLFEIPVDLLPEAEQFKIRMRMTGHGHNSNDGSYPHCCEWKDNEHSLYVNGDNVYNWHIFKNTECAENPVYPQGGTWPGSREGWCPGDIVKEQDFELSAFVDSNPIGIDYTITPVPANNEGMGNGQYWTTVHFFQYGGANFANDVEIYDIIKPNDNVNYRRINPICYDPEILVRNNGADLVQSLDIEYYVSGGQKEILSWEGNIYPNETESITLPVPDESFWIGDGDNKFTVKVSNPNGNPDEQPVNDSYTVKFEMPDMYDQEIYLQYTANNRPNDYNLYIFDIDKNYVWESRLITPGSTNNIPLDFAKGCYSFVIIDRNNMGLSYWAYPDQGQGALSIRDADGKILKNFNPDFGRSIYYSFYIGDVSYVQDQNNDGLVSISPNPVKDELKLHFNDLSGQIELSIYNEVGDLQYKNSMIAEPNTEQTINVQNFVSGVYIIRIKSGSHFITERFVKVK